jgi:hypothetical protein
MDDPMDSGSSTYSMKDQKYGVSKKIQNLAKFFESNSQGKN